MIIIKHIIHIAYPKVVYVFGILYPIITGYDIYICMYKIYGYIWLITMVIIYACMIMYVDIYTYLYG
jgi:hypothetical protein